MNLNFVGLVALCGAFAVACGDSGSGGSGGSSSGGGDTGGNGGTTNVGGNNTNVGGSGAGGPMFGSCDEIPECAPPVGTIDPAATCLGCVIAGDDTIAPDGGACNAAYVGCYGTAGDCSDGLPDCCAFYDCFEACDLNADGTTDLDDPAELDCFCANEIDPMTNMSVCSMTQPAGSCLGDHNAGFQAAFEFEDCAFGSCETACQ